MPTLLTPHIMHYMEKSNKGNTPLRNIKIQNRDFFAEVERELIKGNSVTIKVRGFSMMPLLRDGRDSVVARKVREDDIKVGQVMFFRYRDTWIMHRLRSIDGDRLTFVGDGNNYLQQEHVHRLDVVATVVAVKRDDGREISCQSLRWRLLSSLWLMLRPTFGRIILGINRRLNL